ncbi:MAG: tyrosine/phenylalanine carboxypeptidase domain-containing protein, partial [Lysobacterales bacterium]
MATMDTAELDHHAELDARLVAAVRPIRLLTAASWSSAVQARFLERWRQGRRTLPTVHYPPCDMDATRQELDAIAAAADPDHPLGDYLRRSAGAWHIAAQIMAALGSDHAGQLSARLYGTPGRPLPGSDWTSVDAAGHFVVLADELDGGVAGNFTDPDAVASLTPEQVRGQMQADIDAVFVEHPVSVQVDPDLVAKAAAGASRVRLRANTLFSP